MLVLSTVRLHTSRNSIYMILGPLMLMMAAGIYAGQDDPDKMLEPQSIGEVCFLDSVKGVISRLPAETWKAHGSGVFTATGVIQFPGATSSFHVAAGSRIAFVFNVSNPEHVRLYSVTAKKDSREVALVKVKNGGRTRQNIEGMPVDIVKYGQSSYKLTPQGSLAPGEYAILTGSKVFSFAII